MTPADLDALIERLTESATQSRAHGWDGDAKDLDAAAAALGQLREENARLEIWGKATFEAGFQERQRAERAEAEVARLKDALRQANGVRDVFASAVVAQAMQDIDPAKEKP